MFPTPDSASAYRVQYRRSRSCGVWWRNESEKDYIVLTQRPNYAKEAAWKNRETSAEDFIQANKLRFLRPYQLQSHPRRCKGRCEKSGNDRFLFEMATGTGKTLTAAAIIKLLLRSRQRPPRPFSGGSGSNSKIRPTEGRSRTLLSADYDTVIYKQNRDDWRRAEIVVTAVQSLLFNNKYQQLFSPTDFDLVISDEAHRSIGGNARAVFDFFVGYKLGLTATPRDYLKGFGKGSAPRAIRDPREVERRLLLDTYRTFGCESGAAYVSLFPARRREGRIPDQPHRGGRPHGSDHATPVRGGLRRLVHRRRGTRMKRRSIQAA